MDQFLIELDRCLKNLILIMINLLTEAVIEIEIHANVDSLKKDQSIRDKMNLKVLQDKFNSNLNEQEKFYECLEKF